jgi:site-specific recombinase XerD
MKSLSRTPLAVSWLEMRANLQAPENTLKAYAYDLEDFLSWSIVAGRSFESVAPDGIAEFVGYLAAGKNVEATPTRTPKAAKVASVKAKTSTIRRKLCTVRQWYPLGALPPANETWKLVCFGPSAMLEIQCQVGLL